MLINLSKTAKENFYDLLYEKVQRRLNDTNITYDTPAPFDGYEGYNTFITLYAKAGNRYKNQVTLYYSRMSVTQYNEFSEIYSLEYDPLKNYTQLIDLICQELHLIKEEMVFSISELPELDEGEVISFTISAKENSLLYVGSTTVMITNSLEGNVRVLEDETVRITEGGDIRVMESGVYNLELLEVNLDGFWKLDLAKSDGQLGGFI